MMQDRDASPKEEGDIVSEYKAMHEENFMSIWLREDVENKKERSRNVNKETREEVSRTGKREGEKKRTKRWVLIEGVSSDFLGDSCGLSDCVTEVSSGVPLVTDVLDSSSSLVVLERSCVVGLCLGDCRTAVLVFLQKASSLLCGESKRHGL